MLLSSLIFTNIPYYSSILFFSMFSCNYFSLAPSLSRCLFKYFSELFMPTLGPTGILAWFSLCPFDIFRVALDALAPRQLLLGRCLGFFCSFSKSKSERCLRKLLTASAPCYCQYGTISANYSRKIISCWWKSYPLRLIRSWAER